MPETLFFVHEDAAALDEMSGPYQERGWGTAGASPLDDDALDRIVDADPLAAIICLDGEVAPAAQSLAEKLADDPRGVRPLIVFIGGDKETAAQAKAAVPVAVAVSFEELPWVLKHLAFKS
jgi:hypothetical protein